MNEQIEISKNIEWLKPYIEAAGEIINLKRVRKFVGIGSYTLKRLQTYEALCRPISKRRCDIVIPVIYQKKCRPFGEDCCHLKLMPFSKMDILQNLAHELAHLEAGFDHTPRHKVLENNLANEFMYMLFATGYKSEEKELENK